MSEIVAERFTQLREARGLSQSEVARQAGVGQSSIQRIEAGQTRNPRNILDLAKVLRTTADYLTGQHDDPSAAGSFLGARHPAQTIESDVNHVQVDQIDLRFGLGATYADGHVEVAKRTFDRAWLQAITSAPPSKLAWATGDGDSMEPTIRSGEIVLIDTSADKRRFDDTIWAVTLGEIGMIKRLRSRGDTVELLSDNPLVPPQTAYDGELQAVGRVIAVIRRL